MRTRVFQDNLFFFILASKVEEKIKIGLSSTLPLIAGRISQDQHHSHSSKDTCSMNQFLRCRKCSTDSRFCEEQTPSPHVDTQEWDWDRLQDQLGIVHSTDHHRSTSTDSNAYL